MRPKCLTPIENYDLEPGLEPNQNPFSVQIKAVRWFPVFIAIRGVWPWLEEPFPNSPEHIKI